MDITEALKTEFAKKEDIRQLNSEAQMHYLSPLVLEDKLEVRKELADELAKAFTTMECFVQASTDEIIQKVPRISRGLARLLKEEIEELLKRIQGKA